MRSNQPGTIARKGIPAMETAYRLFVSYAEKLIPVLIVDLWVTPVTHQKKCTVLALKGKPFTDGHHKYPSSRDTLTLPTSKVIVEGFILLSHEESNFLKSENN
jgi:hypothetical protein